MIMARLLSVLVIGCCLSLPCYGSSYFHCQFWVRIKTIETLEEAVHYQAHVISERFIDGYSKEFCINGRSMLTVTDLVSRKTDKPYDKDINIGDRLKLDQVIIGEVLDEHGKSLGDVETWYVLSHQSR